MIYVADLPTHEQTTIRAALQAQGLTAAEVQDGMDSRISDLADTIDLESLGY